MKLVNLIVYSVFLKNTIKYKINESAIIWVTFVPFIWIGGGTLAILQLSKNIPWVKKKSRNGLN